MNRAPASLALALLRGQTMRNILGAFLLAGASLRCGTSKPTFTRDVAPVVFEKCTPCHRLGGSAPFSLESYDDVRSRARLIVQLTSSRYMPPWLPEPGYGEFADQRILEEDELEVLARWAEGGTPEGDARALPRHREWVQGWELGEPDLAVEMSETFDLPAEGGDVFRNFVVPVPLDESRYVEAIEFRPNEGRLVHHATITLDPTASSRSLDSEDDLPGFDGMAAAPGAVMPDGHFLGWTPGKLPYRERAGMSWKLERRSDLVLQLHMPTTGKPERVSARVGLFFSDEPPRLIPVTLRLGSRHFEIPAGTADFTIEDSYVLPVEVEVLSVYPHAHYLAREMKAKAVLPDGSERWLIWIRNWDFKWQDFYRYREPFLLPRGTRLTMTFVYDNSENNPRNPNQPPIDVVYGPRSADEMGDLYVQVLPIHSRELDMLRADSTRKELEEQVKELTARLKRNPDDAWALNGLGVAYDGLGRNDEALQALRDALRVNPEHEDARFNLATLLAARGGGREATEHFRKLLQKNPSCVECRVRLGNVLRDLGRNDDAVLELRKAIELDDKHAWAHYSLGLAFQIGGRLDEAIEQYREVVRLEPENADAHVSLGSALTAAGQCLPAIRALERSTTLEPDWPEAKARLAYALTQCPHSAPDATERAVVLASEAAAMSGYRDPFVLETLGDAFRASGRTDDAAGAWRAALELAESLGREQLAVVLRGKLSGR
ncbi:MAG TPA: tetratricopeptide repeat protein [Vicinamibacteria bacterium]|nr:tetratricopeptide repeat protein [Vicinamibacteria bacterium]